MTAHECRVQKWLRRGRVRTFANYRAECSCGWRSPWEATSVVAEQWRLEHLTGPTVEDVFAVTPGPAA